MASGRNHDRAIYFATPIVFGVGASYFGIELGLIAGAAHYVGGLMLSPDLDLVSRPYKRWGFLRWIWLPYQKLIPRHRFDSSVSLPDSFDQSVVAFLPRSATSRVVWGYPTKCYGVFLWSRAECVKSPATRWVIDSTT